MGIYNKRLKQRGIKMDIDLQIVKTDKMIRKVRRVRAMIKQTMANMDNQYAFTTSTIFRGNIFGDIIRNKRTDKLNSNINKVQKELLRLEADLLLYDEELAKNLRLPAKMANPARVDGKFADIGLRTQMRYRQFDVAKSLRNVEKILDELEKEKKKLRFMKKSQKGLI